MKSLGTSLLIYLMLATLIGAVGFLAGYRTGSKDSFLQEKRRANEPEYPVLQSADWLEPHGDIQAQEAPTETSSDPVVQEAPTSQATDVVADPLETPEVTFPVMLETTQPVRISWPLDIGPDINPDRKDDRLCLRARNGVNEIQEQGTGWALYAFRVSEPGTYQAFCRTRWATDGLSEIACNNSWFLRFDDRPSHVVGNENDNSTEWQWVQGPSAELAAGIHWIRVELREDGPLMDRIAITTPEVGPTPDWDMSPCKRERNLAGLASPLEPQNSIREIEFFALSTGSLSIGKGHVNEITVGASLMSDTKAGFTGTLKVACPSAPGLAVECSPELTVNSAQPFVTRRIHLSFPPDTDRRIHRVTVEVSVKDQPVFRTQIKFLKGHSWAFLGPFKDTTKISRQVYRGTGSLRSSKQACDESPLKIARLMAPAELGLDALPVADGHEASEWKIVEDGSCYDWTGAVDLARVYGPVEQAFAYAVTWIQADAALNHRSFNFQPDDSGWLWVNGHFLAELPIDLPREANRLWTSAKLKRGPNPVVVKLTQNQRYWGFRFDVIDWHWQGRRGDVIRGIPASMWPKN